MGAIYENSLEIFRNLVYDEIKAVNMEKSNGNVVVVEKGLKLTYDITHKARLIDVDAYAVEDAQALYGFIAGISASDHDITDLFIDSTLKICRGDLQAFSVFVDEVNALSEASGFRVVMTASMAPDDLTDGLKKYI